MAIEMLSKPQIEFRTLPKEIEHTQYWVKLDDITPEDLNSILDTYLEMGEVIDETAEIPNLDELRENVGLVSDIGYAQWELSYRRRILEARRRVKNDGTVFVRFKIAVNRAGSPGYKQPMQDAIDNIFITKGVAVPLHETY